MISVNEKKSEPNTRKKKRIVIIDDQETKKDTKETKKEVILHTKSVFPDLYNSLREEIPFEKVQYFKRSICKIDLSPEYSQPDSKFSFVLPTVHSCLMTIELNYNVKVKGIFANLYEDGKDQCPYHKDSYDSTVITISSGESRDFCTKNDETKEVTKYLLEDGDVILFNKEWNELNKHSVPKRMKVGNPRISLVFFA